MTTCPHLAHVKVQAAIDGSCPICLQQEVMELRLQKLTLEQEVERLHAEVTAANEKRRAAQDRITDLEENLRKLTSGV